MNHIFHAGDLAAWVEFKSDLLASKELICSVWLQEKIKYDLKFQMVQWSMNISWVADFNLFVKFLQYHGTFQTFNVIYSIGLNKDLECRVNGLNASCASIMLSSVAHPQLMLSKCGLTGGLPVTEDASGVSGPNTPAPMGMCWFILTTPFTCM